MAIRKIFRALYQIRGFRLIFQCLAACTGIALLTYFGFVLRVNLTTISLLYLVIVIAAALYFGFWQASLTSLLAAACLDFFFAEPIFHFYVNDPKEWVALGVFQISAVVISRLSAKELRSSTEAALNRAGMEQLYELSRNSLLLDLSQAPGPQLVVLIQRIFDAQAVALYDLNLGRQDRAGEWNEGEDDLARQCYLSETAKDEQSSETWRRILLAGAGPVGALVVRGGMSPLIVDALASLAAMAIDRHQSFEKEARAENASKAEQLRAAVMDSMAHEFKTPLTAVQTASSGLLELGSLSDSQRDLVSLINDETIRLNDLCTRLLLTAKLEAGKVGLETDDVNVQELVAEVAQKQRERSGDDRVHVVIEDGALTVRVDRALLAMILAQYIDNARKYSKPETTIEVAVRISHNEVIFSVHNFGSTIRIEDRERVFDRFFRSTDVRDSVAGTGIGLSVVRKAAQAHHGHVWVISDDREGTTFFLSLPIAARSKQ
ncbi:MAG: ATP-binding protein [Terracidiphilus sp.]|jgi:two-component system sensor histidine kinase KdpD